MPSVFQCSTKLSSCASAAVVSAPVIVSVASAPRCTPRPRNAGVTTDFTRAWSAAMSMTATFFPVSVPSVFSRAVITRSRRSEVMSVVSMKPGGPRLMSACVSGLPTMIVWCCLAKHS